MSIPVEIQSLARARLDAPLCHASGRRAPDPGGEGGWATGLGGFEQAVFCAVQRPADHPRRPAGYVPLDAFWRRRGFAPIEGVTCEFSWQDLDEAEATPKPMGYWIKRL